MFVSACAPDFLDPNNRPQARREMQNYFVPPNEYGEWRLHAAYHGRTALLLRLTGIWQRFFTACKDMGVTHPSLLPMGLGILRPKVGYSRYSSSVRQGSTSMEADVVQVCVHV